MTNQRLKTAFKVAGVTLAGTLLLGASGCVSTPESKSKVVPIDNKHALLLTCIPFNQSVQVGLYKNKKRKAGKTFESEYGFESDVKKLVRNTTLKNKSFQLPPFDSICG